MDNSDIKIINWNKLPCFIWEDYAAIVSKVNNKLVIARVKQNELNTEKTLREAEQNHLFDWIDNNNFQETNVKSLTLCITEKCNCACKYCFLDAQTTGKVMSIDCMHSAIDFAFNKFSGNKVIVSAFGGEPGTQEKLINEMIKYSNQEKEKYNIPELKFSITTNGIISNSLISTLIDNNFDVSLSMDGIEEVQNFQRPLANNNDSFIIAFDTLKVLLKNKINVRIRATVTNFSVSKMIEATHLFGSIGAKQLHFEAVTDGGRAKRSEEILKQPNPVVFGENLIECINVAKIYGMDIFCTPFVRCDGTINGRLVIGANGMVSSCVEVQNEKHPLSKAFYMGKVNLNGPTLLENSKMRDINNCSDDSLQMYKKKCESCPYLLFCKSSCPVRNYRATGNNLVTDPFKCVLIQTIMPALLVEFYKSTYKSN
jgi:uncharacterized protein